MRDALSRRGANWRMVDCALPPAVDSILEQVMVHILAACKIANHRQLGRTMRKKGVFAICQICRKESNTLEQARTHELTVNHRKKLHKFINENCKALNEDLDEYCCTTARCFTCDRPAWFVKTCCCEPGWKKYVTQACRRCSDCPNCDFIPKREVDWESLCTISDPPEDHSPDCPYDRGALPPNNVGGTASSSASGAPPPWSLCVTMVDASSPASASTPGSVTHSII